MTHINGIDMQQIHALRPSQCTPKISWFQRHRRNRRTDGHDRSHYLPRQCEAVCNQDHSVEAVKRQYQGRVIRKTRKLTNTTRSRVYVKAGRPSVCLSVCLSHHSTAALRCCGFAAVRPPGRRYRPVAVRPASRRSAANASSVAFTADAGS